MREEQNPFDLLIERERKRKGRRMLCILAIGTALFCYLLFQVVFGITWIEGESMEPELKDGDVAVFLRLTEEYEEGDIVIARAEGKQIVKRIESIEGGSVFLVGDNRECSIDSRTFGEIDRERIAGVVIWVIHFS